MTSSSVTSLVVLLLVACSEPRAPGSGVEATRSGGVLPGPCADAPLPDSSGPTREAFLREMLVSTPTARTPRFEDVDYSYHVDKLELAGTLVEAGSMCGSDVKAVLMIGPSGPLWEYSIMTFVGHGDSVRLNFMAMPHARITVKSTAVVSSAGLSRLKADIVGSSVVRPDAPVWPDSVSDPLAREFSYDLLFVTYDAGTPRYWHARLQYPDSEVPERVVDRLVERVNQILHTARQTYPVDDTSPAVR